MHQAKELIPTKFAVPGAVARQRTDFGSVNGYGTISGEFFSLDAGTDIAPLLKGLDRDACEAPHWGYMLSGRVVVSYVDDVDETCAAGDVFYWPPGHSVRVDEDAEVILFSPQDEHTEALDHMVAKMAEG
jgi:hypothetical protein